MASQPNCKDKQPSCEFCSQYMNCSNVQLALELISSKLSPSTPPHIQQEVEDFKKKLQATGFNFPEGSASCIVVNDENLSKELVEESIKILALLRGVA